MKIVLTAAIALLAVGGVAIAQTPAQNAPSKPSADAMFAGAHWDDDGDDGRTAAPLPRPNAAALRSAGMVQVHEVERDDGRLEVEGRDAQGREIEVEMDLAGTRVLKIDRDR